MTFAWFERLNCNQGITDLMLVNTRTGISGALFYQDSRGVPILAFAILPVFSPF